MRTADAIITADIHLRETSPQCRTDDYWKAQEDKIEFLKELQHKHHDCPILDGGDLFDQWKPSPMFSAVSQSSSSALARSPSAWPCLRHRFFSRSGFITTGSR